MWIGGASEWRTGRRFAVGLLVVYAVLIQALAAPFFRARAVELARLDAALAILCLTDTPADGHEPARPGLTKGHGLDCCLPGAREIALDAPVFLVTQLTPDLAPERVSRPLAFELPQGRAPPYALSRVLQPRAPPSFA